MNRIVVLLAAIGALASISTGARALTIPHGLSAAPSEVTLVAGGCGRGWHRGPYGGCRRNWSPRFECWWVRTGYGLRLRCH